MDELKVNYGRIRNEDIPQTDGTVAHYVYVPIFIGNHGPFTERFTREEWSTPGVVEQRVNLIRTRLQSLPR